MPDPNRRAIALCLSLMAPLAVIGGPPAFAADTVTLPAEPRSARTVVLEPVWSLGAEEDDVLLGVVETGVLDDAGNVLLMDDQLVHVLVVSPTGEVTATLGREGDGPGELRNIGGIFVHDSLVGMVQGFPGKVVYVDREGVPAGGFSLGADEAGGHYSIRDLRSTGTALVGRLESTSIDFESDQASTRATLSVLGFDGTAGCDLVSHQVTRGIMDIVIDEAAEWAAFDAWAVSPEGKVATVAERDAWVIQVHSLAGEDLGTLKRSFVPRQRTDEEKEAATAHISLAVATGRSNITRRALDTDPAIVDVQYARDGRLFVTSCHHAPPQLEPGVVACYEVVAPDGSHFEELTLTYRGFDSRRDVVIFLDGEQFLIVHNYQGAREAERYALLPPEQKPDPDEAEPLTVELVRIPS